MTAARPGFFSFAGLAVLAFLPLFVPVSLSPSKTVNLTSPVVAELEPFSLAVPAAVGLLGLDTDRSLAAGSETVPPADGDPGVVEA